MAATPDTGPERLQLTGEFMRFFALNQRRIYGYISSLLPQHADAEEVLQQTNLMLWSHFEQFRPDGDFISWAFGIARNEVRRYVRTHKLITLDDDLLERLVDVQAQATEQFDRQRLALAECLELLTARDRELVQQCYGAEDAKFHEVARRCGRPANTVYKALARIRRALFDCVARRLAMEGRS